MKIPFSLLLLFYTLAVYSQKPNVILIMTDDQGYGDLGYHGNPNVKTPILDALASESLRFTDFYVSPVCAPTRSSLLTGRYNLRTGVKDTYNGGAIMATNEITIAELLQKEGYRTGVFGKWHLGDNYPSRPQDQGFDKSVIHHAGGMGQVGDLNTYFKGDSSYFDPKLWKNGKTEEFKGYCTDIFTNEALNFINEDKEAPFFAYVAYNAPHTPLQVPQQYLDMYKNTDLRNNLEKISPEMSLKEIEAARKVYAMVSNIDDNVGRILAELNKKDIADNTIVIFMTDNGPQQTRYVGGMRGKKGSVFRGGVRVPFFLRYPAKFTTDRNISQTAAHIDILPTLAGLCDFKIPDDRIIDGISLVPFIEERDKTKERTLFFTWTRKYPVLYQNIALQKGPYRLVANCDYDAPLGDFELYNYRRDPSESQNLSLIEKDLSANLKAELDQQYHELIKSPNLLAQQSAIIGTSHQETVVLNRNDAAGERGIWSQENIQGYWNVEIVKGTYDITFTFLNTIDQDGEIMLELGTQIFKKRVKPNGTKTVKFENIKLANFKGQLEPKLKTGQKEKFPFYVTITKRHD